MSETVSAQSMRIRLDKHAYDWLLVTEKIEAVGAKLQYLPDFLMSRNTYVDQMLSMRVLSDQAANECVGLSGSWPLDGCHWKMLAS